MNCEWNAGHDRYTGAVPAAIAAYHLPLPTQQALIDRWEHREFSDVVYIDRNSIRGQADYAPELRDMNFGAHGRRCDTVTRTGWTAEHVETAIVLCAGDECIAVPSICLNVSRITRIERPTPITTYVPMPDAPAWQPTAGPIGDAPGLGYSGPLAAAAAAEFGAYPLWWGSVGGYGGGYLVEQCSCCGVAMVPAVPELECWALIAAGLGVMAWRVRR